MINWDKLEAYKTDKSKSFEMFCYSIAKRKYNNRGAFTNIDDSGGGDGVEFYLTLPNGNEWGWQAKFFPGSARLKDGGRYKQIEKSLKKSIEVHPKLKKWFLCTNSHFTVEENETLNSKLQKIIGKKKIKVEHWGDRDFNTFLTESNFNGINNYFFGELELNIDWFKSTFEKQLKVVGDKYESKLHTQVHIQEEINKILINSEFKIEFRNKIVSLRIGLNNFLTAVSNNLKQILIPISPFNDEVNFFDFGKLIEANLLNLTTNLNQLLQNVETYKLSEYEKLQTSFLNKYITEFNFLIRKYFDNNQNIHNVFYDSKKIDLYKYYNENKEKNPIGDEIFNTSQLAHNISFFGDTWLGRVLDLQRDFIKFNNKNINILAEAGKGKTHIACNICDSLIKRNFPAIYISGKKFVNENPLSSQILSILEITNYTITDFLSRLNEMGEIYEVRVPLIIDGLNESVISNGQLSRVWKNDLLSFITTIQSFNNIVLITTCRESYREIIWGNNYDNFEHLYGFYQDEAENAASIYFEEYKIDTRLNWKLLEYFKYPLYLKIFCEVKNKEKKDTVTVIMGDESIDDIFQEYIDKCDTIIQEKLNFRPNSYQIKKGLESVGKFLWENNIRAIPIEKFQGLMGDNINQNWDTSRTKALLDENLIIDRNWESDSKKETINFTYDRLAGFIIARTFISLEKNDFKKLINTKKFTERFERKNQKFHPLFEDILKSLCILTPKYYDKLYIHSITKNNNLFGYSINALFEVNPGLISEEEVNFIRKLFKIENNPKVFLRNSINIVFHLNHPLNINFLSDCLKEMPMGERDFYWTEFLRNSYELELDKIIEKLEVDSKKENLDEYSEQQLSLYAKFVMWTLTNIITMQRDKATRALYYFGQRNLNYFLELVDYSFTINDPYVSERMLAALYGICMAKHYDDVNFEKNVLPKIAENIFSKMFSSTGKYYTTHELKREYAYRIIELALFHNPKLFLAKQISLCFPPFKKKPPFKWRSIKLKDEYGDEKASPIRMDFYHYTIGSLINDRYKHGDNRRFYKRIHEQILWRIYNLGYSLERFKEIDNNIARFYTDARISIEPGKVNRYGKKYSWIAFFEMMGTLKDKGVYKTDEYSPHFPRTYQFDIDPSFPEKNEQSTKLITIDLLNKKNKNTKNWVLNGKLPDLKDYLVKSKKSKWVMLDAFIAEEYKPHKKFLDLNIWAIIIEDKVYNDFFKKFQNDDFLGNHKINIPSDSDTWQGEIPWCKIFPELGKHKYEFYKKTTKQKVKREKFVVEKNKKRLTEKEIDDFLMQFKSGLKIEDKLKLLKKIEAEGYKSFYELEEDIKETPIFESYEIFLPVIEIYMDRSNNLYSPGKVNTLSKEMCKYLNLKSKPQSFDLYDSENQKATKAINFEENKWTNTQKFLYIRKDLLDKYLHFKKSKLIWIIWGDRRFRSEDHNFLKEISKKGFFKKDYKEIIEYNG